MDIPLEAPVKLGIVSFDGRVVEFFPNYGKDDSTRFHVGLIRGFGITKGRLGGLHLRIVMGNDLGVEWDFEEAQQPAVTELVQEVLAARGVAG